MDTTGSGPAYTILTPRLALRAASPEHAARIAEAVDASTEALATWMTWAVGAPFPVEHHLANFRGFRAMFERDEAYPYVIFEREGDVCVGGGGLHRRVGPNALEIGYWIRSDRTNRGYATEAAGALTRIGFELFKVERMEIRVAVGNHRSSAVAPKLGYFLEATLRERIPLPAPGGGQRLGDAQVWTMFADQYAASPAADVRVEALDAVGRRIL
ncbi:MAG: GNAT family N-acetyltransferase [Phycisphaerales bacterium]